MASRTKSCLGPVSGNARIAPDSKRSTRAGQKPQKSLGQIISETQQHGTLMPPTKTFRVPTRITPVVPEPRREPTAQPERVVIDVDGVEQDEVIILSRSTPSNRKQSTPSNRKQQDDVSDLTPEPPSGRSIRTPAGKIALDDLLGLLEDAEPKLPEGSPAEFASWLAPRSPPSSNRLNAASALRLRKRARSSSPIMSPRHQIPSSLNAADTDLPLSRDPTLEFLRMYSIRPLNHLTHDPKFQPHDTLSRGKLPGLRPQEAGSSPGLLRKIASCGPEWPSSRSKRRKLEPLYSLAGAVRQPGTDRLSMVNRLIEKMQNDEADGMVAPVADEASHQYHEIREDVEPIRYPPPPNTSRRGSGVNAAPLALAHVSHHPRPTEMALQQTASKEGQETHDDSPLAIGVINWPIFVPPPEKQEAVIKEVGTETLDAGLFDDIDFEDDTSWDIAQLGVSEAPKSPTIHVDADADADIKLAPIAAPQMQVEVVKHSDDTVQGMFDSFDNDDFEEAFTSLDPDDVSVRKPKVINRYFIRDVATVSGLSGTEKVLALQEDKRDAQELVILRDSWTETACHPGSFVHVIGDFDAEGRCIVDDQQNMLIVHPDHLISSTVVADSFTCVRRAVLQDRVKATSQTTKPIVYGQLIHQVFQEAMLQRRMDTESMTELIDLLLSQNLDALYKAGLGLNTAKAHILSKLPAIQAWARTFVGDRPKVNAAISDISGSSSSRRLAVRRLLEVEEHVWSPMYGLKGNIDATVEAVFEQDGSETTVLAPLELKTGHNKSTNHHAQTALYTLLLSDRYDVEVAAGILYYTDSSETKRIPAVRHELRHMVQQRNTLATYLKDRLALPPMKKDDFQCGRCYAKTACFVYHKATEQGDGESSGLPAAFNQLTAHLTLKDQTFFRHWDDLLTKEEKDTLKFRRELWTMTGSERESFGRCFSHVTIEHDASYEQEMSEKINKYQYTFTKPKCGPNFSFVESQISTGEPIVISDEEGHYALANGYIMHVYKHRVIVAVDRKLSNSRKRAKGFHPVYHQTFIGLDGQDGRRHEPASNLAPRPEEPIFYRIDRDEFSNGMATARNNLIQLMDDSVFGSRKVRKLIVEGVAPTYRKLPADAVETVLSQNCLNEDQTKAIQHVLSAKDHALVLGMPGTGKTTTIAQIIRALARLGKSVLLTSYTHSAVDNILLKLKDDKIPMLRLGAMAKIHPEVREFALLDATKKESIEKIRESYQKPKIVATTCLGVNHPVFLERVFDYCIVDEASQITLPVCIGPIRMARSFVLVGDHYQLTPLVKNDEAKAGGLDISLFKYLSDAHPESVVNLEHQYRMNKEITSLSSTLIYQGRLKPGNEKVALQRLQITNAEGLQALHISEASAESCGGSLDCWLRKVVDPENPVCFVATDRIVLAKEQMTNSRIVNPAECLLVAQAVEALIASGVADSSIGVISFYRSQISLLRYALGHRPGVELHTVDKFQGRDKEVVIVSWVRSNEKNEVGELLQDWRRINVAITRARSKLVLVGNTSTLATDDLLDRLIRMIRESACMISLSGGEQDAHRFEALQGTQILTKHNLVEKSSNSDLSWTDRTVTGTPQKRGAASTSIEGDAIIKEEAGSPGKPAILSKPPLKENIPPIRSLQGPKHARVGRRVLLKNRPVLRDILNDLDV